MAQPTTTGGVRRRMGVLLVVLLLVLGGGVGAAWWLLQTEQQVGEDRLSATADKAYEEMRFPDAAHDYRRLAEVFPDSDHLSRYAFLEKLSTVRDFAYTRPEEHGETTRALERVQQFIGENKDHKLWKKYQADVAATLVKLADELVGWAKQSHDAGFLELAEKSLAQAQQFQPTAQTVARLGEIQEQLAPAQESIAIWLQRRDVVAILTNLKNQGKGNVVERALTLVRREAASRPALAKDADILKLLSKLPAAQQAGVKYVPVNQHVRPAQPGVETGFSLWLARSDREGKAPGNVADAPVLALARGVLYALEPQRGTPRWACRVGQETTLLPQELPATPTLPVRLLLLASGRNVLSLLSAATGQVLWEHALSGPCWGQPLLVGDHALLALGNGKVEEIDLVSGRLLGYFDIDTPLLGYGAHQAGTDLVYFPADSFTVYALDLAKRICAGIAYTEHPAGTLRGQPVASGVPRGVLILTQAGRLDRVQLRDLPLPFPPPTLPHLMADVPVFTSSLSEKQQPRGWSWTGPSLLGDRLLFVTEAGDFSLYGLRQPGSRDAPFYQQLTTLLDTRSGVRPGRSELVHATGDSYWILAGGRLSRYESHLSPERGLELRLRWQGTDNLGTPLQAARARTAESGELQFQLTTEKQKTLPSTAPSANGAQQRLALALNAADGAIYWQRKLGLTCQDTPVSLAGKVICLDQDGDLLVLDPSSWSENKLKESSPTAGSWLDGERFLAGRLDGPGLPLQLYPRPESKTVFALHAPFSAQAGEVLLSQVQVAPTFQVTRHRLNLGDRLQGTPGLSKTALVAPLSDGTLVRHGLTSTTPTSGPRWRAPLADADAQGHVIWLSEDMYLVTDGSRGLAHIHWPERKMADQRHRVELPGRIIGPPVLVPASKTEPQRTLATTAEGVVTLLLADTLTQLQQWPLKGRLTAGPEVRGAGYLCLLDERRLLYLDATSKEPRWEYRSPSRLVALPELHGDTLMIADFSGRFLPLDSRTGQPRGEGYRLRADVTAAAAPVPWGAGRWLAPLTDGTLLVLEP